MRYFQSSSDVQITTASCVMLHTLVIKVVHILCIFVEPIKTIFIYFSAMMLSDCSRLGEGYYSTPLLGQHLVTYVIQPWKHVPNYRLRNFIHILFL